MDFDWLRCAGAELLNVNATTDVYYTSVYSDVADAAQHRVLYIYIYKYSSDDGSRAILKYTTEVDWSIDCAIKRREPYVWYNKTYNNVI